MTQHKVEALVGALLDAAVAKAEGRALVYEVNGDPSRCTADGVLFEPSRNWSTAGPLIEREKIATWPVGTGWHATAGASFENCEIDGGPECEGATQLVAAMRAFVARKFGEEVDL